MILLFFICFNDPKRKYQDNMFVYQRLKLCILYSQSP